MNKAIFLTNLVSTIFMTGAIYVVQVVHYPLFGSVGVDSFRVYVNQHNVLITYVVLLPMLLEAGTAVLLLFNPPKKMPIWAIWTGLVLVGVIWFSTFFLQTPQFSVLLRGFDQDAYQFLVNSNWIRTVGWTIRSGLMLWVTLLIIDMN